MLPSIIIPDARGGQVAPQETREDFIRRWHEDYDAGRETIKPPENIRFDHDPDWKFHALSMEFIRAAEKGEHFDRPAGWFWAGIGVLFFLSGMLWSLPLARQVGFVLHGQAH